MRGVITRMWFDELSKELKTRTKLPDGTEHDAIIARAGTVNIDGDMFTEESLRNAVDDFNKRLANERRRSEAVNQEIEQRKSDIGRDVARKRRHRLTETVEEYERRSALDEVQGR